MGVNEDVVEVEGGIPDNITTLLLIKKEKLRFTTRSGIIMSLDKKMGKEQRKKSKTPQDTCYRCGMEGQWSPTCRTAKHLVDLYQTALKKNGKKIEMNFTDSNGMDLSYFDNDFLIGPSENFDYLIDDVNNNVNKYMYFILGCILF